MTKQKIQRIFEQGLDLTQFEILSKAYLGEDFLSLLSIRKIEGIINLMVKKELLDDDKYPTQKGKELYELISKEELAVTEVIKINTYEYWTERLHQKLQQKLLDLTGKKQKVLQGKYSFLPNAKDLGYKLEKVIKKYKIDDFEKIEKVLLQYIEKSVKAKFEYTKLVEYYILKDNVSTFINDYNNYEELKIVEQGDEIVVKNTKDLF